MQRYTEDELKTKTEGELNLIMRQILQQISRAEMNLIYYNEEIRRRQREQRE